MPELVTPLRTLSALELPKRKTSRLSRSFVFLPNNDACTGAVMPHDPTGILLDSKRAVLPWCSGRIATFTKLPVRVRFPSATPPPQILKTDRLVSIKKSEKLSKALEVNRGLFLVRRVTSATRLLCNLWIHSEISWREAPNSVHPRLLIASQLQDFRAGCFVGREDYLRQIANRL